MTDYTKTTNFAAKDSLPSGNANKIVKGTEIDTEFNNIATASATKANIASPTFTGTVTIPTADINGGAVDATTIGASSASSIVGTTIVANTSINIAGDGATVTGIKDEDDMSSNSATKLATQQSIKAYVDSQVTAQDLDVTDGSSSIDIDLDSESLGILGGTGIDSTASGTGVTLAIDSTVTTLTGSQTLTNKTLTAPTLTGTTVAASLDISGDVDVDGTLETDALSINGTTVTSTAAELNILDGVTSTAAELNILDGVTSTTAELNILDGVTSTTAELNILDGVTATAAELNIMDGVTSTAAELNILDGVTSTTAELNILDGVTSTAAELNILDGKAFLDEDDMSSNSATGIASQQSIKAYVDAQITAEDLDFQADSGGALSIDLDSETLTFTGGTGIDTSGSGNAVTFAIDSTVATLTGSQTLTNKSLTAPTLTGTAVVASLDISGDIDVDGTTNLDVVDIDGAVDMASTLTVGGAVTINNTALVNDDLSVQGAAPTFQLYDTSVTNNITKFEYDETFLIDIDKNNARGSTALQIKMDGTEAFSINSSRNATFSGSVTASGSATLNGGVTIDPADGVADDAYALFVRNNEATAGRNYGLMVRGGSNSSDESFSVRNFDNSATYFKVRGDGNVGIGEPNPDQNLVVKGSSDSQIKIVSGGSNDAYLTFYNGTSLNHYFKQDNTGLFELYYYDGSAANSRIAVDTSGDVGIGNSTVASTKFAVTGSVVGANIETTSTDGGHEPLIVKRPSNSDGTSIALLQGTLEGGRLSVVGTGTAVTLSSPNGAGGIGIGSNLLYPTNGVGSASDSSQTMGTSSFRWITLYLDQALNGSDRKLKQDITDLSDAESRVAASLKPLIKKYRLIKEVTRVGDDAKWRIGVIAQDVVDAFAAENLDALDYGMLTLEADTDENFSEVGTQTYNVNYVELLAFIISAI